MNNVAPGLTVGDFSESSLIKNCTSPSGSNFFSEKYNSETNNKMIIECHKNRCKHLYKHYNCTPEKAKQANEIKPVSTIVMPSPFKPSGMLEYLNL